MRSSLLIAAVLLSHCAGATPVVPSPVAAANERAVPANVLLAAVPTQTPEPSKAAIRLADGVELDARISAPPALFPCGHAAGGVTFESATDGRVRFRFTFASTGTGVHFKRLAFADDSVQEGDDPCRSLTTGGISSALRLIEGEWDYRGGLSNVTTLVEFLVPSCGHGQVDIAVNGTLIIGTIYRRAKDCEAPPKPKPEPPKTVPKPTPTLSVCVGSRVTARISSVNTAARTASAVFVIPPNATMAVGFASYTMTTSYMSFPQNVFDYRDVTLSSGTHTLTIKLPTSSYFQLDAYCGTVIRRLTDDNLYGHGGRLLATAFGKEPR